MPSALEGVRVLDLSRLLPGPFATQLLADYGAEVLKIEEPGTGDYLRTFSPLADGECTFFLHLNRNKKSLVLDLKKPEAREVFRKLAQGADVVVESFRPGVMDRLGIGYEALRAENRRLIYCALTGYGQDGPYADKAGHDVNYMGLSGTLGLLRGPDGHPVIPGFQIADVGGGALNAVLGILFALLARGHTGEGQFVDAAMVDGLAPWIVYRWAFQGTNEPTYLSGEFPCYGVYEASDGRFLAVGALEAKFWERLCRHLGRPEWVPLQFDTGAAREGIFADLRAVFRTKPRDTWAEELAPADCCVTPILDLDELAGHPYWRRRGLTLPLQDPSRRPRDLLGFPVKLSETPAGVRLPPPRLGEHTGEVLARLGYKTEEVERLRDLGAVE